MRINRKVVVAMMEADKPELITISRVLWDAILNSQDLPDDVRRVMVEMQKAAEFLSNTRPEDYMEWDHYEDWLSRCVRAESMKQIGDTANFYKRLAEFRVGLDRHLLGGSTWIDPVDVFDRMIAAFEKYFPTNNKFQLTVLYRYRIRIIGYRAQR